MCLTYFCQGLQFFSLRENTLNVQLQDNFHFSTFHFSHLSVLLFLDLTAASNKVDPFLLLEQSLYLALAHHSLLVLSLHHWLLLLSHLWRLFHNYLNSKRCPAPGLNLWMSLYIYNFKLFQGFKYHLYTTNAQNYSSAWTSYVKSFLSTQNLHTDV